MNELEKLIENAGIVNEMRRFNSAEDMAAYVFSTLQQIVRDSRGPDGLVDKYTTLDDVIYELEDLIEIIDTASVRR